MKAKEGILDQLGEILTAELTAVHQYLLHAELCRHWGYEQLAEKFQHLYTEEVTHSGQLVRHILYLGGRADVGKLDRVKEGPSVKGLFEVTTLPKGTADDTSAATLGGWNVAKPTVYPPLIP